MSKEEVPGEKRTTSPGLRDGVRALDRIGQRVARSRTARRLSNPARCARAISPIRIAARTFSRNEGAKRFESETLVLSAGDQDDRFALREQRFLDRVEIGRLRIVDVIDAADFADEFAAMRLRLVGAKRRHHLLERQTARQTDRERRHQVLDVVRAAQFRVGQAQDRLRCR